MREPLPSEALLVYVDRLYDAMTAREAATVRSLLRLRIAMHLPRDVREEALATVRAPAGSFRAPIRLLQFRHRMAELAVEEPLPPGAQLELELRATGRTRAPRRNGSSWKRRKSG